MQSCSVALPEEKIENLAHHTVNNDMLGCFIKQDKAKLLTPSIINEI